MNGAWCYASGGWLGFGIWTLAGAAVAVFVTIAATIVNDLLLGPPTTQPALELLIRAESTESRVVMAAAVVLFAPVFEEILFRGYVYQVLRERIGPLAAMMLSGLFFGLVHLDPNHLIPLTALGASLAFMYERSGTLMVPIAIHALWNLGNLAMALVLST